MIVLPCIVESINPRKDKTWKLTFGSNELAPAEVATLAESLQKFGYLAFKPENFTREEQEVIEGLETQIENTGKTPSQRLRNVLLVLYQHDSHGFQSFATFYEHHLEKIINHYKTKLP